MEPLLIWPREFYLRLTSRCCLCSSAHSASLINLSVSLCSICLPHLSMPLSLVLICLLWPISFTAAVAAAAVSQLSQRASLFFVVWAWLLPFIRLTNKVESKCPHRCTHADAITNMQRVLEAVCNLKDLVSIERCWLPSAG